jgi:S-adenosylmethionine:tRNA ribosyltransferase-isomerase
MHLSDFDFELPKALIAQAPARPRDHARLLVYSRELGQIVDDYFYNLDKYLPVNTTLVLNNSKVEKARLKIGNTEIFVLDVINPNTITALVKPGKKLQLGKVVELEDLKAEVIDINDAGIRTLSLNKNIDDKILDKFRLTPLPPYIVQDESLAEEYQTVYAAPLGSKAAPTAGLHFTLEQLAQIKKQWPVAELTLHVGLGTFAPVKSEKIENNIMHHEWYEVAPEAADLLNKAQHITPVGTTSARTLESLTKPFKAASGQTNIFIKPGYEFKNADALITNFHLPKSTLLMMVAAMAGSVEELHRIYRHAIKEQYRFYSFGDAMIIV